MEILTPPWLATPMREKLPFFKIPKIPFYNKKKMENINVKYTLPFFSLVTRGPPLSPGQACLPAPPAQIMLAVICGQGHLLLDIVSRLTFIRMLG